MNRRILRTVGTIGVAACVALATASCTGVGAGSAAGAGDDSAGATAPGPRTTTADSQADDAGGADAGSSGGDSSNASATYSVAGDVTLSGTLTDVQCLQANADNYQATGHAHTSDGDITIGAELPSPHPKGDQEAGNSLMVGDTVYNRTSMGQYRVSGNRDGENLTVTAKLVNSHDPFDPALVDDHDKWRTVTVTTHWKCGGQLAHWDQIRKRVEGLTGGD